ncbi:hypothetical protein ACMC9I_11010 [Deinococcota bacterium DY0809b]
MISNHEIAQMVGAIIIYGFFFVLTAGLYAMFYAMGRLFERPWLVKLSYLFAAAEVLSAVGMVATGYLDRFWVNLILFSAVTYLFIPQGMWWVVVNFHAEYEPEEHVH